MIQEVYARRNEIQALCQRLGVKRLDVFGSAVNDSWRADDSDIDFLVEFQPQLQGTGYADRYFELIESLEKLFRCKVDLVVPSAIRNPFFRDAVEQSKVLLYAA